MLKEKEDLYKTEFWSASADQEINNEEEQKNESIISMEILEKFEADHEEGFPIHMKPYFKPRSFTSKRIVN
jgi:hypothetical protein